MNKYLGVVLLILALALVVGCTEKVSSDAALPVVGEASEPAAEAESEPEEEETAVEEAVVAEPAKEGMQIIGSDGFSPEKLTVKVGDTIVFTNKALPADKVKDAVLVIQNTVTKQSKTPGRILYGESYGHTFDKAGTYSVWTVAYAAVKGTVIVE